MKKYDGQLIPKDIDTIVKEVRYKNINLEPVYQRGIKWDSTKQGEFINSCYIGIFPTPLIFNVTEEGTTCIDGKQRITSLVNFINNNIYFEYDGELIFFDKIPEEYKNNKIVRTLDKKEKMIFMNRQLSVHKYSELTYEDEVDIFHRIQNGQVISKGELLISSAKTEDVATLLKNLCDKKKNIMEKFYKTEDAQHREYIIGFMYMIDKNILTVINKVERDKYIKLFTNKSLVDSFNKVEPVIDILFGKKILGNKDMTNKINKNYIYTLIFFIYNKFNGKYENINNNVLYDLVNHNIDICQSKYKSSISDKSLLEINKLLEEYYKKKIK